jgi:hypothetical protein
MGEIKCLLRPATAHERFQYNERIEEAAIQASRKAEVVQKNARWLSSITDESINSENSRTVVPFVLLNSPLGALKSSSAQAADAGLLRIVRPINATLVKFRNLRTVKVADEVRLRKSCR